MYLYLPKLILASQVQFMHLVQNKTKISNIDFFKNALPMHLHRGLSSTNINMIKLTYMTRYFQVHSEQKANFLQNLKKSFYHSEECSSRNGKQDGSCASGFGVCCVCKYEHEIIRITFKIII